MQGLKWDEYEFIECFGVVPEYDEDWGCYYYRVEKDGLILRVKVDTYQNEITLTLYQNGSNSSLMRVKFFCAGSARYRKEKCGDYLEFTPCFIGDSYRWREYWEANASKEHSLQGITAYLSVTPSIHFQFDDEFA